MPSNFPADLDDLESNKTDETPQVSDHAEHHNALADAINAVQEYLLNSGSVGQPRIVEGGNLGASYTLDLDGDTKVWLVGVLNSNLELTLDNIPDGAEVRLLLKQDGTGGRTLAVTDGLVDAQEVQVATDPNTPSVVDILAPGTADLYVVGSGTSEAVIPFDPVETLNPDFMYSPETLSALANNDPVALWTNEGTGDDGVQGTSGNKPVYKTAIRNGLSVVRFVAASDKRLQLVTPVSLPDDFTIFIVSQSTGDSCLLGGSAGAKQLVRVGQSGLNKVSFYDGTNNPASDVLDTPRGSWSILEIVREGTSLSFFENGVAKGVRTVSVQAMNLGFIGEAGTSLPTEGDIGEVFGKAEALSADDRALEREWLGERWAITVV